MRIGTWIKKLFSFVGIKTCSSCQRRADILDEAGRRGFIRGIPFLIGMAFVSLKSMGQNYQPDCIFCPCNGHGYWICLQCESQSGGGYCCDCTVTQQGNCIFQTQFCNNCSMEVTYGACCRTCMSQLSQQEFSVKPKAKDHWNIILNDGGTINMFSSGLNENELLQRFRDGNIIVKNSDGKKMSAQTARKIS